MQSHQIIVSFVLIHTTPVRAVEIVQLNIISILDIDLKHLLYNISIELFYEQIIIIVAILIQF